MFLFSHKTELADLLPQIRGQYKKNEPMSKHTWFGVGGPAEIMFIPADREDLKHFLTHKPQNVPVTLIGGGSNLLVRDGGIPGVTIKLETKAFRQVEINGLQIKCGAGLRNSELKKILIENSLGGLEFLCSIPGMTGGSIKTNAGCFGREIKDVLIAAEIINSLGEIQSISPKDLNLSYRSSFFPEDWIILSLTLQAEQSTPQDVEAKIQEQKNYRLANQPHNVKTAGSTFKNPEGLRAWELIKKSGCSGLSVGGARVSEKHNNFLINTGNATAEDIERLGENIIARVKQQTAVTLEWEVKRLGRRK